MAHPFPALKVYPQSTLTFPWAEWHGSGTVGTFDAALGSDGASVSMVMVINWADLQTACTQVLGYSYRDNIVLTPDGHPYLRRIPPWQHPYFNQLYVKRIAKIQGVRIEGNSVNNPVVVFQLDAGGVGAGPLTNIGPFTQYNLALLTINFWRPPYAIRSDLDILDGAGNPQEWLRWVDRNWQINTNMLCREANSFVFVANQGAASGTQFQSPLGQKVTRTKVIRRWYEVPEACLFKRNVDLTPSGIPYNLLYTQTTTTNPVPDPSTAAGNTYLKGNVIGGCLNITKGGTANVQRAQCASGAPQITNIGNTAGMAPGWFVDGAGITSTILTVDSPTQVTLNDNATITDATGLRYFVFEDPTKMFWGCFLGTLLLEAVEITPRPLQLPATLMRIPAFNNGEPISQNQYDITFHFELFDPPRAPKGSAWRGHNLSPYSGDGFWYMPQTQVAPSGTTNKTTLYQYADFTDLFKSL